MGTLALTPVWRIPQNRGKRIGETGPEGVEVGRRREESPSGPVWRIVPFT